MNPQAERILECLHEVAAERVRRQGDPGLAERVHEIKRFQHLRFQRTYADLMVELAAAKAGNDPVVLRDTKIKVAAYRETQRLFGAPRPGVINNFSEPSDAELIEAGY